MSLNLAEQPSFPSQRIIDRIKALEPQAPSTSEFDTYGPPSGFSAENQILRDITTEVLRDDGDGEINIGRRAFRELVMTAMDNKNQGLVVDEWNKNIVGHSITGNIRSPLESAQLSAVGLRLRSKGPDELRDQTIGFIKGIMEGVREQVAVMFERNADGLTRHQHTEMNKPDTRLLALGLNFWRDFVRGGVYEKHRSGAKSLTPLSYLAAEAIDGIIDDIIQAEGMGAEATAPAPAATQSHPTLSPAAPAAHLPSLGVALSSSPAVPDEPDSETPLPE